MGQIVLDGTLTIGPQGSGGDAFPSSVDTVQLASLPNPKMSQAASGTLRRNVAVSQPNWLTLSGVGPTDAVTLADTLYFKTQSPMRLRLTQVDMENPTGPPIVSIVEVYGTCFIEFPTSGALTLLEVRGVGTIEYMVSGQQ